MTRALTSLTARAISCQTQVAGACPANATGAAQVCNSTSECATCLTWDCDTNGSDDYIIDARADPFPTVGICHSL